MFEVQMGADPITELSTSIPRNATVDIVWGILFLARNGSFICERYIPCIPLVSMKLEENAFRSQHQTLSQRVLPTLLGGLGRHESSPH